MDLPGHLLRAQSRPHPRVRVHHLRFSGAHCRVRARLQVPGVHAREPGARPREAEARLELHCEWPAPTHDHTRQLLVARQPQSRE